MANLSFSNYAFAARNAPALRTTPVRLVDVVNVRDWGARGDNTTDDTPAIQAAINYAATRQGVSNYTSGGSTVYFPPGTYLIGTPPLYLFRQGQIPSNGGMNFIGAGREASVIRGNYPGWLCQQGDWTHQRISRFSNMTIRNESRTLGSGCLYSLYDDRCDYDSCRFIGVNGIWANYVGFPSLMRNCIFENIIPIPRADSAAPGVFLPPSDDLPFGCSVGLYPFQGAVMNCHFKGLDIGIARSGVASALYGNKFERCRIGLLSHSMNVSVPFNSVILGVFGNAFDRCTRGIQISYLFTSSIAGNVISGIMGPADPMPIQNMTWSGGITTVQTATAHNISNNSKIQLAGISPAGFVPSQNAISQPNPAVSGGYGFVTVAVDSSTQFHYSGPGSNPGFFVSGSWNYPIEYAIDASGSIANVMWGANVMSAVASLASVNCSGPWLTRVLAMHAPYGWSGLADGGGSWRFDACTQDTGTNPLSYLQLGNVAATQDGQEFSVVDGQTQNSFGGTVSGGGSNHYKVRRSSGVWTRAA